jgi:hypothetical protein
MAEVLESRTLLASAATSSGSKIHDAIADARQSTPTAAATINLYLKALETNLLSGPVQNLAVGSVDGNGFVQQAQTLEASYESAVDQELYPAYPRIDTMLKLAGEAVVAEYVSLNQQATVGLISSSGLISGVEDATSSITNGPIHPLDSKVRAFATTTKTFETDLNALAESLSTKSATPLSPAAVSVTLRAETEAYRALLHEGLQVHQPGISNTVDVRVWGLQTAAGEIGDETSAQAQSQLEHAIRVFDATMLDTTGLFGPAGHVARAASSDGTLAPARASSQNFVAFNPVAGTATATGTATLTATLYNTNTGLGVSGKVVTFTLDGAFAGVAVTNNIGVATLSNVSTSDSSGTDTGGVVATFTGDISDTPTTSSGDLVVSQIGSTLTSIAGTATYGSTATLTATLTSATTNAGIAGQTVDFTLDGSSVGSAVTNSSGVATLAGVTTSDSAGTDTGGVVATYAGNSTYASTSGTGNLVVTQAGTALSAISGTATYGGTATLTATLMSTVTNQPISDQTVSFTLGGTSAGTAVTNSSGVATLTGVTSTASAGTDTDGVVATFAGATNYATTTGAGNLVVSQAATTVTSVSGTASFGGTATLVATLTSSETSAGVSGQTINFTLNGVSVGTATTNTGGVATLTGITTTAGVGTDTGAVVATFAGTSNYVTSSGTGNLVVSQAGTTLASVSGTATYGGTATLVATLTSNVTSAPISGETVTFMLNGTSVGTAVTNSTGVATLTNVPSTAGAGTVTDAVGVSFAGDTNYVASTGIGNLVVSQANSTLASVAGTASYGGTATLAATLTSALTGNPIAGDTVAFTLGGTQVGTATTNSSGVATLANVASSAPVGTDTGAVGASFTGDMNFLSSTGSGDLVVSQAATSVVNVSGTATGGLATLTATLNSQATGAGVVGETLTFKLDGTVVGTAVTGTGGIATLMNVPTADPSGPDTGGVVVVFDGDDNYLGSSGVGDLTVS